MHRLLSTTGTWSLGLLVPALLGTFAVAGQPTLQTYAVPGGNAEAVARSLSESYPPSPGLRIDAVNDHSILVYASPEDQAEIARRLAPRPEGASSDGTAPRPASRPRQGTSTLVAHQFVDPREEKNSKDAGDKEKSGPPVTITAFGNKLMITSDDPAALAAVQQLAKMLQQTPGGEGDYEVIHLKNATATEAAKVLDEVFNGPKQPPQPQQPQGRGFAGRLAAALTPPPPPREERVRVVADPETNTLLVKASPLDLLTIRRLLSQAVDRADVDSAGGMHTWVIGPLKYAIASEVVTVLQNVYREQTDNNPLGVSGRRGRPLPNQNLGPDGQPRGVSLTIGLDDRTNSIVVSCTNAMHEDIKRLVDELEKSAQEERPTVRVMPVAGIDPSLVQEAVDVIQGRATGTSRTANAPAAAPPGGIGGLLRSMGGARPGLGTGMGTSSRTPSFRPGGR